jgi:pyridoxal 5'-phosphate synthase pdxT subunit
VAPTIGILALQGDVREHRRALEDVAASPVEVRGPEAFDGLDGLIIPGGESTTMSLLLESAGLLPPLRERVADGLPVFGTCAGMILLAHEVTDGRPDQQPLGAIDITVRRNAFGRQRESFETTLTVAGLDAPLPAVFIRAPVVDKHGPGVDVLATVSLTDDHEEHPVLCRQGPVLVSAFHPELTGDRRLHHLFVRDVVGHQ